VRRKILSAVSALLALAFSIPPVDPQERAAPRPAAQPEKAVRSSPPYTISLELSTQSPFVPDGRMSLAELSFRVVFSPAVFEFDADEDPLLGRSQVNTDNGKGILSRLVLNEVQRGEERLSPAFLTARPRYFAAGLAVESEPTEEDEAASKTGNPPEKVRLSFWTEFGTPPVKWGSPLGSAELSDYRLVFEVPFRRLLEGRPYTATLPYEGRFPEDKGTWRIEFIPGAKKGKRPFLGKSNFYKYPSDFSRSSVLLSMAFIPG
jgi:hypothetical protein